MEELHIQFVLLRIVIASVQTYKKKKKVFYKHWHLQDKKFKGSLL